MAKRAGNDRTTPRWLLNIVEPVALDPCSNPWSEVNARVKVSKHDGQDGLALNWQEAANGGLVFCNPPYSRGELVKWARKCAEESLRCDIAALVPLDPTTEWFRIMELAADGIVHIGNRVHFGGGGSSNPRPSALFLFGNAYNLREWQRLGRVLYYDHEHGVAA